MRTITMKEEFERLTLITKELWARGCEDNEETDNVAFGLVQKWEKDNDITVDYSHAEQDLAELFFDCMLGLEEGMTNEN